MLIRLEDYELFLIENETAANTMKNYLNTLKQLNDYLVANNVETIKKEHLIRFKEHLKDEEYRPGKKYTVSTINQKIVSINVYFNWALDSKDNDLKLKTYRVQNKSHRESPNEKEFKRLLRFAKGEILLFILTISNTGLRISEVCHLKKKDLTTVEIKILNKGKYRTIGIPSWLKKQLLAWDYVKSIGDDDIIFAKTQQYYRDELKNVAGRANVLKKKVYPHAFRHYFAKAFLANDGDSTTLQQMLGHSSIATTTIYTHLNSGELAEKFSKMRND